MNPPRKKSFRKNLPHRFTILLAGLTPFANRQNDRLNRGHDHIIQAAEVGSVTNRLPKKSTGKAGGVAKHPLCQLAVELQTFFLTRRLARQIVAEGNPPNTGAPQPTGMFLAPIDAQNRPNRLPNRISKEKMAAMIKPKLAGSGTAAPSSISALIPKDRKSSLNSPTSPRLSVPLPSISP